MARLTKADVRAREVKQNQYIIEDLEYNKALIVANNARIKNEIAEIERLKKERLQGLLVPVAEVEETFIEIASRTKAELNKFISILPPKLEGLNAPEMINIIREHVNEILLNLSNSLTYKEPKELEVIPEDTDDE